jgi:hypothetical protein
VEPAVLPVVGMLVVGMVGMPVVDLDLAVDLDLVVEEVVVEVEVEVVEQSMPNELFQVRNHRSF